MMRHLLPILLLFFALGARGQGVSKIVFKPDTTVNGVLQLLNPRSIEKAIGDQTKWVIEGADAPRVLLTNSGRTEYLILYLLPGGWHNDFNEFEVGVMKEMRGKFRTTKMESFAAESGVRLGMTEEELVAVKGKKFARTREEGKMVLRYTLNNFPKGILGRYNMPEYEASYFFDGGRLVKFLFGFPMP